MSGPFGETVFRLPLYLREGSGVDLRQVGGDNRELTISSDGANSRSLASFDADPENPDNTADIQDAIDWSSSTGNRVVDGTIGTHIALSPVELKDNTFLDLSTAIRIEGSTNSTFIVQDDPAVSLKNVTLRGGTWGPSETAGHHTINFTGERSTFENLTFMDSNGIAMILKLLDSTVRGINSFDAQSTGGACLRLGMSANVIVTDFPHVESADDCTQLNLDVDSTHPGDPTRVIAENIHFRGINAFPLQGMVWGILLGADTPYAISASDAKKLVTVLNDPIYGAGPALMVRGADTIMSVGDKVMVSGATGGNGSGLIDTDINGEQTVIEVFPARNFYTITKNSGTILLNNRKVGRYSEGLRVQPLRIGTTNGSSSVRLWWPNHMRTGTVEIRIIGWNTSGLAPNNVNGDYTATVIDANTLEFTAGATSSATHDITTTYADNDMAVAIAMPIGAENISAVGIRGTSGDSAINGHGGVGIKLYNAKSNVPLTVLTEDWAVKHGDGIFGPSDRPFARVLAISGPVQWTDSFGRTISPNGPAVIFESDQGRFGLDDDCEYVATDKVYEAPRLAGSPTIVFDHGRLISMTGGKIYCGDDAGVIVADDYSIPVYFDDDRIFLAATGGFSAGPVVCDRVHFDGVEFLDIPDGKFGLCLGNIRNGGIVTNCKFRGASGATTWGAIRERSAGSGDDVGTNKVLVENNDYGDCDPSRYVSNWQPGLLNVINSDSSTRTLTSFGADPTGVASSQTAVDTALNVAMTYRTPIEIDAGLFRLTQPTVTITSPIVFTGAGPFFSWFIPDDDFEGDVFSASRVGNAASQWILGTGTTTVNHDTDPALAPGLVFGNLSVRAKKDASKNVNGLVLYDQCGQITTLPMHFHSINGCAFACGLAKNFGHSFLRESDIAPIYAVDCGTMDFTIQALGATAWVTTTAYALNDKVTQGGVFYTCMIAHTSGTFATDLAALKWCDVAPGSPTFYIGCVGSFDDTNQVNLTGLKAVYTAAAGIRFENLNQNIGSIMRLNHIFAIQVHGDNSTPQPDYGCHLFEVIGRVNNLEVYGLETNAGYPNNFGLYIAGNAYGLPKRDSFRGCIGTGANGIWVADGQDIDIRGILSVNSRTIDLKVGYGTAGGITGKIEYDAPFAELQKDIATAAVPFVATMDGTWILAVDGTGWSHTGDTAETLLVTVPFVDINLLGPNGYFDVETQWSFTGAGGTRTPRVRIGLSAFVAGSTPTVFTQVVHSSAQLSAHNKIRVFNKNIASAQVSQAIDLGVAGGWGASTVAAKTSTISSGSAFHLDFSIQLANAGDTATLEWYEVKTVRKL